MSGILSNCVFVIDKSIPLKKKVELIKQIKANGGASVYSVTPKATHLVTNPDNGEKSSKVDSARSLGIHVVSKEFVTDSIAQGAKLEEKQYEISDEGTAAAPSPPIRSSSSSSIPPSFSPPVAPHSPVASSPSSPPAPSSPTPARPPPGFKLAPTNIRNINNNNNNHNHNHSPNSNHNHNQASYAHVVGSPPRETHHPLHYQSQSQFPNPFHHHPTHPIHALVAADAGSQTGPAYNNDDVSDQSSDDTPDSSVADQNGEAMETGPTYTSGPEENAHGDGADGNNENRISSPARRPWRDDRYGRAADHAQHEDRVVRQQQRQQGQYNNYMPRGAHDHDGCKVFVGGIMFDDLDALGKTKDGFTDSPDVISHIQKMKQERLLEIIKIFNKFGAITRVKQFLEERHIFISYDNQRSAITAVRELKSLEVRKKIVQDIRDRLKVEGRQTIIAPRVSFYVRWPNKAMAGSQSESDRGYSGRSDGEGSWRRGSAGLSDNEQYSSSAFSASESESDQHHSTSRYLHPNHRHASPIAKRYDSDSASDSGPRQQEVRSRRLITVSPPQTASAQATPSTTTNGVPYPHALTSSAYAPSTLQPSAAALDNGRVDWLWIWSKVIILLQVVAIITIVYFYNKGGF